MLVGSSSKDKVEAAVSSLKEKSKAHVGGRVINMLDDASVKSFVEWAAEEGGKGIDHLSVFLSRLAFLPVTHFRTMCVVYTATGPMPPRGSIEALDVSKIRSLFDTRIFATLTMIHAALPHFNKGASIIITSGTAGKKPYKNWFLGATACGAVEVRSTALAPSSSQAHGCPCAAPTGTGERSRRRIVAQSARQRRRARCCRDAALDERWHPD